MINLKNVIAGGLTLVAVLTSSGSLLADNMVFIDTKGHWANVSIAKAVNKGYVDGYQDGTFKPDQNVSRAEFIKMLALALKFSVSGTTCGSDWYLPYVNATVAAGIHHYDDFTSGDWNTNITRLEMARLAVRATMKDMQQPNVFMDDKSFMFNATKTGLIQGLAAGELGIEKATTRAQSVTIIERVLSVNAGQKLEVDKYALSAAEIELKHTNMFSMMPEFFGGRQDIAWDINNQSIQTDDVLYKASVQSIIAIDLADPDDPNLKLLPPLDTLKWFNTRGNDGGFPLTDVMNSYVLYFNATVDYNKDTNIYRKNYDHPYFSISGALNPDIKAFKNGDLNMLTRLFIAKDGDVTAWIIPKNMKTRGLLEISIYAPISPPGKDFMKSLIQVNIQK